MDEDDNPPRGADDPHDPDDPDDDDDDPDDPGDLGDDFFTVDRILGRGLQVEW